MKDSDGMWRPDLLAIVDDYRLYQSNDQFIEAPDNSPQIEQVRVHHSEPQHPHNDARSEAAVSRVFNGLGLLDPWTEYLFQCCETPYASYTCLV